MFPTYARARYEPGSGGKLPHMRWVGFCLPILPTLPQRCVFLAFSGPYASSWFAPYPPMKPP